jgi:light-regulated signal transduction histidine kinase (bacteriophytochrome)
MLFTREPDGWVVRYVYRMPEKLIGKCFNDRQVRHTAITAVTKEPLAIPDAYHDDRAHGGFVRWLKIRSLLDFPLIVQDQVIGDVAFHYHTGPHGFSEHQIEFVRKLQISLSLAIKNARLFEDLQEAKTELETFDYTLAHDLRNALNVISLYCQSEQELCVKGESGECRQYLDKAVEGTFRMNRLIDGILKLSQLSHALLKSETVDLSLLAKGVAEELQRGDPGRRVKFIIGEGIAAPADPDLMTVVMENLLGNAWKYTRKREEAVIEFGMVEDKGLRAYFVRDNGVGFDMAQSARIFRPFQRLEQEAEFRGFGIGLATVERIVRRHGGEIWAVSEPDKGAAFYFTLP